MIRTLWPIIWKTFAVVTVAGLIVTFAGCKDLSVDLCIEHKGTTG